MDAERGNRLELGEEVRDVLVGLDVADLDVAVRDELADVEVAQVDVACARGQVRARRNRDGRRVVLVHHRRAELEAEVLEQVARPGEMATCLAQADDLGVCRRENDRVGRLGAVGDEVVADEDAKAVARTSGRVHGELEVASELRVDVDRDLRKARSRSAVVDQAHVDSAGDVADAALEVLETGERLLLALRAERGAHESEIGTAAASGVLHRADDFGRVEPLVAVLVVGSDQVGRFWVHRRRRSRVCAGHAGVLEHVVEHRRARDLERASGLVALDVEAEQLRRLAKVRDVEA